MSQKYVVVKKEVEELKEKTGVKPAFYSRQLIMCPNDIKAPPFHYCKIKIEDGKVSFEPASEAEQMEGLKGLYERLIHPKKHMRKQWPTFKSWIAHKRKENPECPA